MVELPEITIDKRLCKRCLICKEFCPQHVYEADSEGYPKVCRPEDCSRCQLCFSRCPEFALEVK